MIYKIRYKQESERIMEVQANSEEEAIQKYKNYDWIRDYEVEGLGEEVISVTETGVEN